MKNRKRGWIALAVLLCLTALGLCGNPFPAKAEPTYVHCSVDHGPHSVLAGEAAEAVTEAFSSLRLSWFPEPKTVNLYLPQAEKQYMNLVLGNAAFLHIFVLEDDTLFAYAKPWSDSRTYRVMNPEALAPLVPLPNK